MLLKRPTHRRLGVVALLLSTAIGAPAAFCQHDVPNQPLDYNEYYRFPVSIGVEYQTLMPFMAYGSTFNIFGLAVDVHVPMPRLPVVQPLLRAGFLWFDGRDPLHPDTWDHTHYYAELGVAASHRFTKAFEVGADLLAGFSEAVFPSALPEEGAYGSPTLIAEIGGRIGLDPSYGFCIDIRPGFKYLRSFSSLHDFDGPVFSLGFSAQYRFGEDPDAPRAVVRSIRFDRIELPPLFAAMQSYYATSPVGSATITNTEKEPLADVAVYFFQKEFMDSPTPAHTIDRLEPGETRTIDLLASFNRQVFSTEGVMPLTGEVQVSYRLRGRPVEQAQPVSYDLHDKTAIVWNDDRKVAAFITPADGALRNYMSFIRQSCRDAVLPDYNDPLQVAIQVFDALGELGCRYQADPSTPFAAYHGSTVGVDSVSLPRDTLKRSTGDCDDLTVAFCSLLESVGVETGFITVPGHILPVFNTKVPARSWQTLHPDRSLPISLDGELWVPVEITLVGKGSFLSAWRRAAETYASFDTDPGKRRLFRTGECQKIFRPVALTESDLGLQYGSREAIAEHFRQDLGELSRALTAAYRDAAERTGKREDYNRLGVELARTRQFDQAATAFELALAVDPGYLSARINLGSLWLLRGEPAKALERYREALDAQLLRNDPVGSARLLLNMAKALYELKDYAQARDYHARAAAIDPEASARLAYLAQGDAASARSSGPGPEGSGVLFLEEEQ
jgi:hypothetical protein